MNWSASWHPWRIGGGNWLWIDCLIVKITTLIIITTTIVITWIKWTCTNINNNNKYSNSIQRYKLFNNNISRKIYKDLNKIIIIKGFWVRLWLCSPHLLLTKVIQILITKGVINVIKETKLKRNNNNNLNKNRDKNKNHFYSTKIQTQPNNYPTNKIT